MDRTQKIGIAVIVALVLYGTIAAGVSDNNWIPFWIAFALWVISWSLYAIIKTAIVHARRQIR